MKTGGASGIEVPGSEIEQKQIAEPALLETGWRFLPKMGLAVGWVIAQTKAAPRTNLGRFDPDVLAPCRRKQVKFSPAAWATDRMVRCAGRGAGPAPGPGSG
jgi:hypothetical protein